MSRSDDAVGLFRSGCACSQSVLGAFAADYGLDESTALKLACGFASGMRRGLTCGAVTGGHMVLGLALAGDACRTVEGRATCHDAVAAFSTAFEARHGALECRQLLGVDVSTPEGRDAAKAANLFATRCAQYVHDAAELVEGAIRHGG